MVSKDEIIKRRSYFIIILTFIIFLVIIFRISYLQVFNNKASLATLKELSVKTVYGDSMPRGRIYDRNYNPHKRFLLKVLLD